MRPTLAPILLTAFLTGCTINQKEGLMKTALDKDSRRADVFEATLRVLDEKPEYVDEFFAMTKKSHPKTLDSFTAATAASLDDETLAKITAKHLNEHPAALKEIMKATMEAAADKPEDKEAIAEALEDEAAISADVITGRPTALSATLEKSIALIAERPAARKAFVASMQKVSAPMAAILENNPATLKVMMKEVLKVGVVKEEKKVDDFFGVKELKRETPRRK